MRRGEGGSTAPALKIWGRGSVTRLGVGLVDRLIHSRYRALGAVTLTFERTQGALEGAARLR